MKKLILTDKQYPEGTHKKEIFKLNAELLITNMIVDFYKGIIKTISIGMMKFRITAKLILSFNKIIKVKIIPFLTKEESPKCSQATFKGLYGKILLI